MMLKWINILFLSLVTVGCVGKTQIEPGDELKEKPVLESVVSVAFLKTKYRGFATPITENIAVEGVVTANDRYDNFLNTIVIEDKTGGIEVKVDGKQLYTLMPIGCPVRIMCTDLVLGGYAGTVSLGTASDDPLYQNSFIRSWQSNIYFDVATSEGGFPWPEPTVVTLAELSNLLVGRYVRINEVQFVDAEQGLSWCNEGLNTDRHIVDRQAKELVVRTLYQARFANKILPSGSGSIDGILSVFAGKYQLRVVYDKYVVMDLPRF